MLTGYVRIITVGVKTLLLLGIVLAIAALPAQRARKVEQSTGLVVVQGLLAWVMLATHPFSATLDQAVEASSSLTQGLTYLVMLVGNTFADADDDTRMRVGMVVGPITLSLMFCTVFAFLLAEAVTIYGVFMWIA